MATKKTAKEQIGVDVPEADEPVATEFHEPARTTAEEQAAAAAEAAKTAEPERPDWLPEQYKTPEAFVEAHRSLQERLRQEAENRKLLEQRTAELEAAQQQAARDDGGQQQDVLQAVADEIAAAREVGDVRRELELQQWVTDYQLRQSLAGIDERTAATEAPLAAVQDELIAAHVSDSLGKQFDDWDEYKEEVAQLIAAEPWRLPNEALDSIPTMQAALGSVYESVKARKLLEQQKELEQRGLTQADVNRARKLEAQTMTGTSGRPDEPSPVDRELAEMKDALRRGSGMAAIMAERSRQ